MTSITMVVQLDGSPRMDFWRVLPWNKHFLFWSSTSIAYNCLSEQNTDNLGFVGVPVNWSTRKIQSLKTNMMGSSTNQWSVKSIPSCGFSDCEALGSRFEDSPSLESPVGLQRFPYEEERRTWPASDCSWRETEIWATAMKKTCGDKGNLFEAEPWNSATQRGISSNRLWAAAAEPTAELRLAGSRGRGSVRFGVASIGSSSLDHKYLLLWITEYIWNS